MTESTSDAKPRDKALRKAYALATARLREAHRDEFDKMQVEEAKALGFDYSPKPKPEAVAERQMEELLDQFPELRKKYALTPTEPSDPETASDVAGKPVTVVEH